VKQRWQKRHRGKARVSKNHLNGGIEISMAKISGSSKIISWQSAASENQRRASAK